MIDPFEFLIYCLACFRLSLMVSKEDGPAWIFLKLRREVPKKSSVKEGINCQWCVSVWAGILLMIWYHVSTLLPEIPMLIGDSVVLILAISGGGICFNQQFTKG